MQRRMLAALTLASLHLLAWASDLCPSTCQCEHNLTTVTCQDRGLRRIPALPQDTHNLYISYNEIEEIPEHGLNELQVRNSIDITVV